MNQKINSIIYIASILFMAGCSADGNENTPIPENGVRIEVEAPQMNGWSTEENSYTRSGEAISVQQKGEDGLDMKVDLLSDTAGTFTDKATTRWTNMDDNTVFRVVAYACTSAATITTSNYKGYGDYKLLANGTVQTVKSLTLPLGTYTFVCYSYGNSTALSAFSNTTTSITTTNGNNFMTCVKPNIVINNIGSTYTLSNIVFTHHCVRYRVSAAAQSGRMANITACAATLTLPKNSATYNFTNNGFTINTATNALNTTWNNPNAMTVYSNYVYILPQSASNITVNLNITIGGKAFNNKSTTLSGITLNANGTYRSNVSFTTEGYIVGGALWANGNLYKSGNSYFIYNSTEVYVGSNESGAFFTGNNPEPYPSTIDATPWTDANDPCRKLTNAVGKWRLPKKTEFDQLVASGYTSDFILNGVNGCNFGNTLFLPYSGYIPQSDFQYVEAGQRGLLWSTPGSVMSYAGSTNIGGAGIAFTHWSAFLQNHYGIRCVRNI
ncbi:hypothetical protein [Bacteroides sp.]|uniref:hypothetical protein n=1 Tax=Bacteroides sp. TaxID=29523 RepID=UPI0026300C71|nr:hypothetical protein [Bacteroides sp.]